MPNLPTNERYIEAAREIYERSYPYSGDANIEIVDLSDHHVMVSRADNPEEETGAFVKAWVWVHKSNIPGFENADEEEE